MPKDKPVTIDFSEKSIKTSKLSEFYEVQLHNQLWKLDLEKKKILRKTKDEINKEHGNLKHIHKPCRKRNATVPRNIKKQCPDGGASRVTKPSPVVMAARRLLESIEARKKRKISMSARSDSRVGMVERKSVDCWNEEPHVTTTRFGDRRQSYSSNSSEDDVIIPRQIVKNMDNAMRKRQMRLDSRESQSFEHSSDECDAVKFIETSPTMEDEFTTIPYPQHSISPSLRRKSVSFCIPEEDIHPNSIYHFRKSSLRDIENSDDPRANNPLPERRRSLTGIRLWRETATNMCDQERANPIIRAHDRVHRRTSVTIDITEFAPELSNNQKAPSRSTKRMLQRRNSAFLLTSYLAKAKTTMTTNQLLEINRLKEKGETS